jgi:hypothetical protein
MVDPRIAAADFLFGLLDDIDTAEDIAKSDDAAFRAMVHRLHRRRFEVADTNGYTVTFKDRVLVAEPK